MTTPKYYVDVLNAPLWFSVRFLLMSYVVFTLLGGAFFGLVVIPQYAKVLHPFIDEQIKAFPADGVIGWNGLKLTTNMTEAYTIPFPQLPYVSDPPQRLLTVDPAVENESDIKEHIPASSFFVVGKDKVFVSQPDGTWSTILLRDVSSEKAPDINKALLIQKTEFIHSLLQVLLRVTSVIFPVFFMAITFAIRFVTIFIYSLLIFFGMMLFQFPMTFKKTLQINLHIMVIAEMIALLTLPLHSELDMFGTAFWLFSVVVYWQLRKLQLRPPSVVFDPDRDQD